MTPTLVLLVFAAVAFGAAMFWYASGKMHPESAQAGGLLMLALAFGLYLQAAPPQPIPPDPPDPDTRDFGGYRPHYQGFGATTPGGRGGSICRVGELSFSRLQECVNGNGPRIVTFDVSGTIDGGGGQLTITNPFLTLAGQTAPSANEGDCSENCGSAGGITLINARLLVDTHDVVIQHLRIRRPPAQLNACSVGDAGDGGPNDHVFNVVTDHITCSWATEVNNYLAAGPGSHSIQLLDSLIAEGLWPGALGGIGAGIASDSVTMRNLFSQHYSRQPIWGSPTRSIISGNVTYNGTDNSYGGDTLPAFVGDADGDGSTGPLEETMLTRNVFIPGPNSGGVRAILGFSKKSSSIDVGSKVYMQGNTGPGITGPDGDGQWVATVCGAYGNYQNAATCGPSSNMRTNSPFGWFVGFQIVELPAASVRDAVLANAGARPRDRDAADVRMIADVTEGDGSHFLDWNVIQNSYGGMPAIARRSRSCNPPSDPNGVGQRTLSDGTRNTRVEDWLEGTAAYDGTLGCGARRLEVLPAPLRRR